MIVYIKNKYPINCVFKVTFKYYSIQYTNIYNEMTEAATYKNHSFRQIYTTVLLISWDFILTIFNYLNVNYLVS